MNFHERFARYPLADDPASYQILMLSLEQLSSAGLSAALRDYHPSLATATAELVPASHLPTPPVSASSGPPPTLAGLIEWPGHAVKLIAFDTPMPAAAVESCIRTAMLPLEMKEQARQHAAHVLLYYAGPTTDPFEQQIALAMVAGCLTHFGAMFTLNEEARAAVASFVLLPEEATEDMLDTLRKLPIPFLYGGFVKMSVSDQPGLWFRTFACPRLGLPNLAYHAASHDEGERLFHLFSGTLNYLRETGVPFEAGEIIKVDDDLTLQLREPTLLEWWLDSPGKLWVLQPILLDDQASTSQTIT